MRNVHSSIKNPPKNESFNLGVKVDIAIFTPELQTIELINYKCAET